MNIEELREKVKTLPMNSGVYIMKNNVGEIIYIGKAKHLKNRVKQYFDGGKKQVKVQAMVDNVFDFEYIITNSDTDAFLLENNLIKKHKPKYNILLKDDKRYPYIKITINEKFPQVLVTRKVEKDDALYFGPYVNVGITSLIEIVRQVFKVRTCKLNFENEKEKKLPCLHGQIGKCLAPCCNFELKTKYDETIKNVIEFLKGDTSLVLEILNKQMQEYAENEDFENAIFVRDKLKIVENINEKTFAEFEKSQTEDVFAIYQNEEFCVVDVMNIRNGKNLGQSNYQIFDCVGEPAEILTDFVCEYYSHESLVVKNIITNMDISGYVATFMMSEYDKLVDCACPVKGNKKKIVELAELNAKEYAEKLALKDEYKKSLTLGALEELKELFNLNKLNRIEGYDVSNIQGTNNVASMVVFENGEAKFKEYRKFKIKTVEGADDFASLKETLNRRFERYKNGDEKFLILPDLILIDGGLGQLCSAKQMLDKMGLDIAIVSLAKKQEEIYVTYSSKPIVLNRRSFGLKLLQRVRDESHRFAITFHRNIRNKEFLSEFEKIEGVGKKTRIKILKHFKSVDELFECSIDELKQQLGVSKNVAQRIFDYVHKTQKR